MRLTPGDPAHIEAVQDEIDRVLQQDWKGRDADELAGQLRKLRLRITVMTVEYQAQMRELQEERRRAS